MLHRNGNKLGEAKEKHTTAAHSGKFDACLENKAQNHKR
jgi:hypothetical protein